ncbi:sulfite oxidase [Streptacidiphilus rugosus]|uniref:sulfite oxidase n=1 Tax=Streptacidiphilus rugosus TaxID=405783 RepID=UPI00055B7BD0|nr:sulfite oxidase [Streptacidiphilus rugosus]
MTEKQLSEVSVPARIAAPDEGITQDELHLAGRNHAMPLEALRYDITPVGLHYLLVHYDIPDVDPDRWRLVIDGRVGRTVEYTLADLWARPKVTRTVTFECAGNGRALLTPRPLSQPWLDGAVGTARWGGTPLAPLLREAGIGADAVDVVFTGRDHGIERGVEQDFTRGLPLAEALREDVLLAYEMNDAPLPPQHGAPLRLVVPGWYGMAQVKWLRGITLTNCPFDGFQQTTAYRLKQGADEIGEPVTRIMPRALMIPPGFPDFMSRVRVVDAGVHVVTGRAWSGRSAVRAVEFSADDGRTWAAAELGARAGGEGDDFAWYAWRFVWRTDRPGSHRLRVRATDAEGVSQPREQAWNRQGMANNMAQCVEAIVR